MHRVMIRNTNHATILLFHVFIFIPIDYNWAGKKWINKYVCTLIDLLGTESVQNVSIQSMWNNECATANHPTSCHCGFTVGTFAIRCQFCWNLLIRIDTTYLPSAEWVNQYSILSTFQLHTCQFWIGKIWTVLHCCHSNWMRSIPIAWTIR